MMTNKEHDDAYLAGMWGIKGIERELRLNNLLNFIKMGYECGKLTKEEYAETWEKVGKENRLLK